MVPQKCQYRPKSGSASKDRPQKSGTSYHTIWGFINTKEGKYEPNYEFKLQFGNVYYTMELAGGGNILQSKQLINNES